MKALTGLLIVPLLWANTVPGAETPKPWRPADLELEEVLVKGRKPATSQAQMAAWLRRLVGEFRYEGHVERYSSGATAANRAEVQGGSRCTNIGAPGLVQCTMNVRWDEMPGSAAAGTPGGESWLTPAVAVFGMYVGPPAGPLSLPDPQYIGHIQIDSRGLAETGLGQLYDDTLIYSAPCADLPGKCQRVVQIEAPPDGEIIRMSVDVQRDSKLEARYVFQWHRTAPTLASQVPDPEPTTTRASSMIMPAAMQTWAGKLVGTYRYDNYFFDQKCRSLEGLDKQEQLNLLSGKFPVCQKDSSPAECLAIGSGTGVRCRRGMRWQETSVPNTRAEAIFELWGYDPVAQRMVSAVAAPTYIKDLGALMFGSGTLSNDTLTLTWSCPKGPACKPVQSHVIIPPDGSHLRYTTQIGVTAHVLVRNGYATVDIAPEAPKTPETRNPSPRRP